MSIHFVSVHYSAAENRKNSLKTLFWNWRLFRVTDDNSTKKHVTNACYDK